MFPAVTQDPDRYDKDLGDAEKIGSHFERMNESLTFRLHPFLKRASLAPHVERHYWSLGAAGSVCGTH